MCRLELNRNFSSAHFHLASELALLGELDQARAAAQAGLALDPGFTIRRFRAGTATGTLAAIGAQVGYESEAAFSRAFKRETGLSPAAWRRARQTEFAVAN